LAQEVTMNTRHLVLTWAAIGFLTVDSAAAGERFPPAFGDRVRLRAELGGQTRKVIGRVVDIDDTGLVIVQNTNGDPSERLRIDWPAVREMELSRGRRSGGPVVAGAIFGGLWGLTKVGTGCLDPDYEGDGACVNPPVVVLVVGAAATVGAAIGAILGGGAGGERWQDVPPRRRRLGFGVTPVPRGAAAHVALQF
jgi:hypothetical protein